MGVPKSWKTVEIEQQCKFGWTEDGVTKFLDGWSVVKDYAWILQNKCVKEDGVTPVDEHIHCMIRFNDSVPTTAIIARAKSIFGNDTTVTISNLEKCKKWKSAVAYLTHENVTGKHIYDRSEVHSNYNFEQDIEDALSDKIRLSRLLNDIADGKVKDYNIYDSCTVDEYANWKTKIDSAFNYRAKILMAKGDRDMKCIYIQGDSGTGKTSYAKELCESKEFSYFVSSGSNDVLDGYGGQDAIILDDLRPSALSLADLLKMLDNNTSSSVKSRYRNKVLECRLIIITTVLDINDFFSQVFKEQPETAKQLRRRCETYIRMYSKTMVVGAYNRSTDNYVYMPEVPNPIALKYGLTEEQTVNILANSIREMLRGSIPDDMLDKAVQSMIEKSKNDCSDNDGFMSMTNDNIPFD